MRDEEKFSFLQEEERCYKVDEQKNQIVYRFKDGEYRGLIAVPRNEEKYFWYKYFMKGDSNSYQTKLPVDKLPLWFKELVEEAQEKIEKRDRVRRMFKKQYIHALKKA